MKKKGGTWIVILVILIILILVGGIGAYFYLNNPSRIIKNEFYNEFSYQACELNFNPEFIPTKEKCYEAHKCVAEIFLKLVAEEDRKDVAKQMKKNGGEAGFVYYAQKNPTLNEQLEKRGDAECY